MNWKGVQVRDAWGWQKSNHLVAGLDLEVVNSISRSYTRTGDRQGPFSADNNKNTIGVYAENTMRVRQGATVISLGGRVDRITVETVDTPFKNGSRHRTRRSPFSTRASASNNGWYPTCARTPAPAGRSSRLTPAP